MIPVYNCVDSGSWRPEFIFSFEAVVRLASGFGPVSRSFYHQTRTCISLEVIPMLHRYLHEVSEVENLECRVCRLLEVKGAGQSVRAQSYYQYRQDA